MFFFFFPFPSRKDITGAHQIALIGTQLPNNEFSFLGADKQTRDSDWMRAGVIRIRQMEYGFFVCDRRLAYKHTSLISGIGMAVNINNISVCHKVMFDVCLCEGCSETPA